jgi:hypothetical protein
MGIFSAYALKLPKISFKSDNSQIAYNAEGYDTEFKNKVDNFFQKVNQFASQYAGNYRNFSLSMLQEFNTRGVELKQEGIGLLNLAKSRIELTKKALQSTEEESKKKLLQDNLDLYQAIVDLLKDITKMTDMRTLS